LILSSLVTPATLSAQDTVVGASPEFTLEHLPLIFEANQGQADANVRFLSRTRSYAIYLEDDKAVLALPATRGSHDANPKVAPIVTLELQNANRNGDAQGLNLLPGKSNYFIGRGRSKWLSGIRQFEKVRFKSVYPGIDLVYYGGQEGLE